MLRVRRQAGSLAGLGILLVTIPLLRDLFTRERPGSGAVVAGLGYGSLLVVGLVAMRLTGISLRELGIRKLTIRALSIGVLAGALLVVPVWHVPVVSISGATWLVVAVAVEEFAFRGVLFALLQRRGGVPLAIIGSSLAFTVAHAGSAGWPSLLLVALAGLYFGLLRALSRDLWAAGLAHLLMDIVSLP